jgi:hypothetical protein
MPLYGTLTSMPLTDLLQWLCNARVTGTLHVERDRVSKSIHLHKGMIVGCSSDDPAQRIGHFLLSRGQITEEQLREALQLQEISGQHLGMLLVELGALSPETLSASLEAQAEETIHSLFDWDDAGFRFQESEDDPVKAYSVSLRVEDVLLRGLQRYDEMKQIREVFDDPGIVLETTGMQPPTMVTKNRMARTLWELVNGERTVAEILLQVHGSEYVVTKFLFELHRSGLVRIACVKPIAAHHPATKEPGTPSATAAPAAPAATATPETKQSEEQEFEDLLSELNPEIDLPVATPVEQADVATKTTVDVDDVPAHRPVDPRETGMVSVEDSASHSLEINLEKARCFMVDSEFEKAFDILDRLRGEQPGDESLRRLAAEAEAAFVEKAYRHYLPPSKVLALTRTMDGLRTEDLSPSEFFLLSRIDGTWDIKSIIQIAPLRESDTLRTLKRLRENGLIELKDP